MEVCAPVALANLSRPPEKMLATTFQARQDSLSFGSQSTAGLRAWGRWASHRRPPVMDMQILVFGANRPDGVHITMDGALKGYLRPQPSTPGSECASGEP